MNLNDTIVALASAPGEGAIAIIRLSGSEALSIAGQISDRKLINRPHASMTVGHVIDPRDGHPVDEVVFALWRAPHSFTREEVVEIQCHGGMVVVRTIIDLCIRQGARLAQPGEFSYRAVLNGRIDLSEAEAIMDMVRAHSPLQMKLAMQGLDGSVSRSVEPLLEALIMLIGTIEVNIDYPEYDDVEQLTSEDILPRLAKIQSQVSKIVAQAGRTQLIRQGIRTVIIGKPNVGKSSLLNALIREEKAIVTDIPGTTRDLVEGWIHLGNVDLHLIDTAGLRQTDELIERIGIEKSREALATADLILLVMDGSQPRDAEDEALLRLIRDRNYLLVFNKCDIKDPGEGIRISAQNHELEPLIDAIRARYAQAYQEARQDGLSNPRQISAATQAERLLAQAYEALQAGDPPDLVTLELQDAYRLLASILKGDETEIDLYGAIFSRFCLGK